VPAGFERRRDDVDGRDQREHGGPPGGARPVRRRQQRDGRLEYHQRRESRTGQPGDRAVSGGDEDRGGGDHTGVCGGVDRVGQPGQVDPPGGVAVEEYEQQPHRRERLGRRAEPAAQCEHRYEHGQDGDRRQDRGPPADSEAGPRHRGEDDRGAAEQQPAEDEEQVLDGPR
jgi:hypothetical protein